MTPAEINTILISTIAFLGTVGAACKWVLLRVDAKQTAAAQRQERDGLTLSLKESEARGELSRRLHDEIHSLRKEIHTMHAAARVMMRRIYDLERTTHATPGLVLPDTEGWPPI